MNPSTGRLVKVARRGGRAARLHGVRRLGWIAVPALAVLVALPAASATSAALVTGKQIKDGSVTGRDVHDDSIAAREFGHLPSGPQGPEGVQGPQGLPGAPGAAGTSGWVTVVSDGVPVAPSGTAFAEVTCPSGVAVGGGVGSSIPAIAQVNESAPLDFSGTGWGVTVHNIGLVGQPLTIFAWATCVAP